MTPQSQCAFITPDSRLAPMPPQPPSPPRRPPQISDPDSLDAIFVPVGGGGLIAGIAAFVKALKPSVQVSGVRMWVRPHQGSRAQGVGLQVCESSKGVSG